MDFHGDIDYLMLISDSLVCGLLIYLTYSTFKLLRILKNNQYVYEFGSNGWWHWIEHSISSIFIFIGALGASTFKVAHTIDQTLVFSASRSLIDTLEIAKNIFMIPILIGFLILIKHINSEEVDGGKFVHTPRNRRLGISRQSEFHRRIGDKWEIKKL